MLIPSHFSTHHHDMCHGTIDSGLIKIQTQPDQVDMAVIRNRCFYYNVQCCTALTKFDQKHGSPPIILICIPYAVSEDFLGIIGRFPCVSRVQPVTILTSFWVILYELEAYSVNTSKLIGNFPIVFDFNWLLFTLNCFICN